MEGIIRIFGTGIFATVLVSSLDGGILAPGSTVGNVVQVGSLEYISGMYLRVADKAEVIGLDPGHLFDE